MAQQHEAVGVRVPSRRMWLEWALADPNTGPHIRPLIERALKRRKAAGIALTDSTYLVCITEPCDRPLVWYLPTTVRSLSVVGERGSRGRVAATQETVVCGSCGSQCYVIAGHDEELLRNAG